MTKTDNATQGKFTKLSSGYQAALMTHVVPTTLQATDWETFLVRIGVIVTIVTFRVVFSIIWPS
jgi:urea transporter